MKIDSEPVSLVGVCFRKGADLFTEMKSKVIFEWAKRTLHISGTFQKAGKPDIETEKPDIDNQKTDIEKIFQPKTASHILKLRKAFPQQSIFGRSDVMEVIGVRPSRASELLRALMECGMIEPVSGHGKGKYRFRQQRS